jgi:transposase
MRKPGSPSEWENRRMIAANMFEQGLPTGVIRRSLGVDDQTVRRWRRLFKAQGRQGLLSRQHAGRPSRLSDQQKQELYELLLKKPCECGFDKYLWTQQLIADLILREFGVSYHHDHIGVILKEINFTHQKPMRRAKERDEARIESWRRETWPELLKKVPQIMG